MFKQPTPQVQTTTLWDFPSQHYGQVEQGDSEYIGATPSYVIWNLLQRYTRPGDRVLDPMCGSGTTLDVCKDLGRQGLGFDLAPSRPDIKPADARRIPLESQTVDFAFIDPPYSTHIRYSGDEKCIGELDARGGGYYEAMEEVIAEIYRVLKDGAYFALYVSDSQAKNKSFCPIGFELFFRMSRLFDPVDIICVTRHNKSLKRNHWHTSAIEGNFFLRGFNYLFVMRKNREGQQSLLKHEEAGMLSPLFEAASRAKPGEVITPERFSQMLEAEKEELAAQLSKKKQKKLGLRPPPARPTRAHRSKEDGVIKARPQKQINKDRPRSKAPAKPQPSQKKGPKPTIKKAP